MKTYSKILILLSVLVLAGCDDLLEPKTDNTYPSSDTWRLADKAKGVLYNAYAAIGNTIDAYDGNFLDCATSDALTNNYSSGIYKLGQGVLSTTVNPLDIWELAYAQFANIHMFLENGLNDNIRYSVLDEEMNERYKTHYRAEAYFLRAWWGWQLLRVYGGKVAGGEVLGYPIVLSTEDGKKPMKRDSYERCVSQILQDLDTAMEGLPDKYLDEGGDAITGTANMGKACRNAAWALKAIVCLYAASDAYQPDNVTDDERQAKWERAARLAEEAIGNIGGKPAWLTAGVVSGDNNTMPVEYLFALSSGKGNSIEKSNFPPYWQGSGRTNPSQNLVDAYPMKNGFPISDSRSDYDQKNPYSGRDPRLEMTILYNGAKFKGSTIDMFEGGKDSRSLEPDRASRTGYYLKKWIVDKVSFTPGATANANHYYPLIRHTEVWLAFAEAANQAWGPIGRDPEGGQKSAYDALAELRAGAGITDTEYLDEIAADGKEAFDKLVLNERRLELAFENHRYFDIRRRLLKSEMAESVKGVDVIRTSTGFEYTVKEVEHRYLSGDRYIYSPIPFSESSKNPLLEQNVGW